MAADGSPMVCDQRIPNLQWTAQNHTFATAVGVIPLRCFDMIVGLIGLRSIVPCGCIGARKSWDSLLLGKG